MDDFAPQTGYVDSEESTEVIYFDQPDGDNAVTTPFTMAPRVYDYIFSEDMGPREVATVLRDLAASSLFDMMGMDRIDIK